jgi:hypothetical protein
LRLEPKVKNFTSASRWATARSANSGELEANGQDLLNRWAPARSPRSGWDLRRRSRSAGRWAPARSANLVELVAEVQVCKPMGSCPFSKLREAGWTRSRTSNSAGRWAIARSARAGWECCLRSGSANRWATAIHQALAERLADLAAGSDPNCPFSQPWLNSSPKGGFSKPLGSCTLCRLW